MKRKTIALILCLCMLLAAMAGCGSTAGSESTAPAASADAASAEEPAAEEAAAPAEEPAAADAPVSAEEPAEEEIEESAPEPVSYSYPLFDETLDFSMFWRMRRNVLADLPWWQNFESNLGVKVDWISPGDTAAAEQYNLLIASGDYPDLIFENSCSTIRGACPYNGGYDKAIADEVYMDLTDYLDEYCPNYAQLLASDESLHRDLSTDDGKYYCFAMVYEKPYGVGFGVVVRDDYFADTGLKEYPRTTDEWLDCLKTMKNNGVQYPMGVFNTGDLQGSPFAYAFGSTISSDFKVDRATNELIYDGTSDETRAYLEYFAEAWDAGLISPDFFSLVGFDDPNNFNGVNGIFGARDEKLEQVPVQYGFDISACPVVTLPGESVPLLCDYSGMNGRVVVGSDIVVTTGCDNVEKVLTVMDWFYSPEGFIAANYGWNQGESWDYNAEGEPELFDWINDTDPNTGNRYKDSYILDDGPFLCDAGRENPCYPDSVIQAKALWDDWDFDATKYITLPAVNLSAEESERVTNTKTDIDTYVESTIAGFMTGQTELTDETWKAYVDTVNAMGIDEVTEVYTAAYERYLSR